MATATEAPTLATPTIDFDEAHTFLNALGGPNHVFQILPERPGCQVRPHILEGTLDQHKKALTRANRNGAGIFVTVNRAVGGRKKANVRAVRALFVDLDGAPVEPVLAADPAPDLVVQTSPGRFHGYWITRDVPLEKFKLFQKALIEKFGADPACTDLPRTMRLPGFLHQKRDPFFVRIISIDEGIAGYA